MTRVTDLLARLKQQQDALGLSERALCRAAGVSEQAVKRLRAGHRPNAETWARLAAFLALEGPSSSPPIAALPLPRPVGIPVIGTTNGTTWHASRLSWAGDPRPLRLPTVAGLPTAPRFAFDRQGPGLDRLYPLGSLLILMSYPDLGRAPAIGDRLVALRYAADGRWNCAAWEYAEGPDGQALLWPRSDAADLQAPLLLGTSPTLAPTGPDGLPAVTAAAGVLLLGVVVQSLQPEPWLPEIQEKEEFAGEN